MSKVKVKKIIAIVGPTASGKTKLGVNLAYYFNGEIISADSRQVYRGMDIGTGKDLKDFHLAVPDSNNLQEKYIDIPYHLIDVVLPEEKFSLANFCQMAQEAIKEIFQKNKIPIVVGGTGLYMQALVDEYNLTNSTPDYRKRAILENLSLLDVQNEIQKINSDFFQQLNKSEQSNKRRLIRYLEQLQNGKNPFGLKGGNNNYEYLVIGIAQSREVLSKRIYKRLISRLEGEGMIDEVKRLHEKDGVSWERLDDFGLEYRYISLYLQKKINYKEMVEKLNIAIRQFAKRQMSWLRRWEKQGRKIYWVNDESEAKKVVADFLKKIK